MHAHRLDRRPAHHDRRHAERLAGVELALGRQPGLLGLVLRQHPGVDPAAGRGVVGDVGHEHDLDLARLGVAPQVGPRERPGPDDAAGALDRQQLEVLGGHRPPHGEELVRPPQQHVLDRLDRAAAACRLRVGDLHPGDRVDQLGQHARADVARGPAAGPVPEGDRAAEPGHGHQRGRRRGRPGRRFHAGDRTGVDGRGEDDPPLGAVDDEDGGPGRLAGEAPHGVPQPVRLAPPLTGGRALLDLGGLGLDADAAGRSPRSCGPSAAARR